MSRKKSRPDSRPSPPAGAQPGPPPSQTGRSLAWAEWAGRLLKAGASLAAPAAPCLPPGSSAAVAAMAAHRCALLGALVLALGALSQPARLATPARPGATQARAPQGRVTEARVSARGPPE